jgi:hypothetical protein
MRLILTAILSTLMVATMALAKNCTGANCQCGDTLMANFVLPGNAYCPNVPMAISIGSSVTLDCGGHTISLSIRNTIVGGKTEQALWQLRGIFPAIPSQNRFMSVHFSNPSGMCVLFNSADGNVFEDSWFDCGNPDVACTGDGVNTFVRPRSGESGQTDGVCGFVVQ